MSASDMITFFGLTIGSNEAKLVEADNEPQSIPAILRISTVALGLDAKQGLTSLLVSVDDEPPAVVATLSLTLPTVHVDLLFNRTDNIKFETKGVNALHISGYEQITDDGQLFDEEDGESNIGEEGDLSENGIDEGDQSDDDEEAAAAELQLQASKQAAAAKEKKRKENFEDPNAGKKNKPNPPNAQQQPNKQQNTPKPQQNANKQQQNSPKQSNTPKQQQNTPGNKKGQGKPQSGKKH